MANTIAGTVYDPLGRPAAGVPVSISGALAYHTITSVSGAYTQAVTATGTYQLKFGMVPLYNEDNGTTVHCAAMPAPDFTVALSATVTMNAHMRVV